ncbi:MAG: ATP-grasp domain-containing protein [bacterium]|nr:ATP-grasp domain-containing protein [bacterium]
MKTVVIVANCESYRVRDFVEAAETLRCRAVLASDAESPTASTDFVQIDLADHVAAAASIAAQVPDTDAVIAADDSGVVIAAHAAELLGLSHNSTRAAAATRDKLVMRDALRSAQTAQPGYRVGQPEHVASLAADLGYPVVIKPRRLSASRGVIKAHNDSEARWAGDLATEVVLAAGHDPKDGLLVEEYVPGAEVAIEGLLHDGELTVLAVIDKPVPLEGPFFAETIFVTPSRLPAEQIESAIAVVADGCRALHLVSGPIHGEVRITPAGEARLIEIAARTIGGLCGRSLAFGLLGESLETIVLRGALGEPNPDTVPALPASGVLMLPVEDGGILNGIDGIERVSAIPGITAIEITATKGTRIDALPEADRYLGFVFAAGHDPSEVEGLLRRAASELTVVIDGEAVGPLLPD